MGNNHTFQYSNGYVGYDGQNVALKYVVGVGYKGFKIGDVIYRHGIRYGAFCTDRELYEYGFLNTEGKGWINVFKIKY